MPALFKMVRLAEKAANLQRHRLAVCGLGAVAVSALLGTSLLILPLRGDAALSATSHSQLNFRHIASVRPGSRWDNSPWAGSLEEPAEQPAGPGQSERPLTSSSYTSGFDKKAAGLSPLPQTGQLARATPGRNPMACPDDLNCSFRPAKAGGVAIAHHLPAPTLDTASNNTNANSFTNVAAFASAPKTEQPDKASQPGRPNGFALLTSFRFPTHLPTQLPSASTLLKPFTFVSNTVVGFVKRL